MRRLFRRDPEVGGEIAYHGLQRWWFDTFTEEERALIDQRYKPMGAPSDYSLVRGTIRHSSATPASFLSGLATWFDPPAYRSIQRRCLLEAERLGRRPLDRHLVYSGLIEHFYQERDRESGAKERAIQYCEAQIAIGPDALRQWKREHGTPVPYHVGFQQLAIVREKEKDYQGAIRIAEEAKKQGWQGDWDKRIARCRAKAAKASS